jgi:Transposase domain (DUF772)
VLEKECKRNVEVMWLMKQLVPDHNTISNFRRDNEKAIRKVFRYTVSIAKHFDLIGGKLVAGDSTKLRAQNSKKNNFTPKKIEKHLLYIDSKLDEYNHALAAADGDNKATIEKEIQKHTQRRENYVAKVFHSNPSPPHPKRLIIEPELFNPCWCFFTNKGMNVWTDYKTCHH